MSGQREQAIDIFKGLLVLGMVYCHSLQFFSDPLVYPNGSYWIETINLLTFSGFVFSFGYVSELAYYSKPFRNAAPRMALAALKTLIAFYISGLAYRLFVDGREIGFATIRPILLLQDMPGWSEFLISFSYLTVAGMMLFVPLRWLAERKWIAIAVAVLLLATTWLPYGAIHISQLAPLMGTRDLASFPILQYFPYYLVGILFAKYRVVWNWKVLTAAGIATAMFVWKWLSADALPERFPPSVWWIIGSALLLYVYYLAARGMEQYAVLSLPFAAMGRNVLWFLVMSNILIFALSSTHGELMLGLLASLIMTVALLMIAGFAIWIITKKRSTSITSISKTIEHKDR
ncbi:hypothetical protein RE628_28010 [Paenibacillus sp. D2_2]|uniref:acyltransferase family protein n=1 Tax=Paenibacillus sp. D2_2 TaxID=3073092 RepID=UPI002816156E|nr:acyltransferase family protein [Paenibacillus sp. D2_2]WMT40880.1 hypothetical protein RE628_28010 [Paenibacillus sp. D2_2]